MYSLDAILVKVCRLTESLAMENITKHE